MNDILRIKELIFAKGITGEKLAEMINVSPVTISRIISGKSGTNLGTLIEIAKALDVDVRDLFAPKKEEPIYIKKGSDFVQVGSIKKGDF
ncbi:hypothetical protein GCM10028791_42250 [Echinicola sediminis]